LALAPLPTANGISVALAMHVRSTAAPILEPTKCKLETVEEIRHSHLQSV
jgi:hypothetical protein